jgi:hypothetical protein
VTVQSGQATANLAEQMLAKIRAGQEAEEQMATKADAGPGNLAPRTPPGPRTQPLPLLDLPASAPPAAASSAASGKITAQDLIDENAPWLPAEPDRKAAFFQVYRYWHAQVRPESAAKARPAFLFLVTALPMMVKARDDLKALNLWEPPGEQSRQARDAHSAWRRYCDMLPRAQQALGELDSFSHLSLLSALDDLQDRILKAEVRYRQGLPKMGRR